MNQKKQVGILFLVAAIFAGFWSFNRYTSFFGQLYSWTPPFSRFEIVTILGAAVAILLLLFGLRLLGSKEPVGTKSR